MKRKTGKYWLQLLGTIVWLTVISIPVHAGIEEHSPNPGPEFEEWELIQIDLDSARDEANREDDDEYGVDQTTGQVLDQAPLTDSRAMFLADMQLKWKLAPYGVDWVSASESTLLEGLVPSTLDAPSETDEEQDDRLEPNAPSDDETTESGEEGEHLSELEGRLNSEENGQPMAGCSTRSGTKTGILTILLCVFGLWGLASRKKSPEPISIRRRNR